MSSSSDEEVTGAVDASATTQGQQRVRVVSPTDEAEEESSRSSNSRTLQNILSMLFGRGNFVFNDDEDEDDDNHHDDDEDDDDDDDDDQDDDDDDDDDDEDEEQDRMTFTRSEASRLARLKRAKRLEAQKIPSDLLKRLRGSDFALLTRRTLQDFRPFFDHEEVVHDCVDKEKNTKDGLAVMSTIGGHVEQQRPRRPRQELGHLQLPQRLLKREMGGVPMSRKRCFNFGDRCMILDSFLPNRMSVVAKFKRKVFCGSFSNQGDLFMSACHDQKIRIYETRRGRFDLQQTIRARNVGWSVLDTALSPDGQHLIYSSWSDYIHQVNLYEDEETESRHRALALSGGDRQFCLFSIRFSSDGFEIIGGSNDGFIYLYDRFTQSQTLKIDAHDDDVNAVSFVDDRTHILASAGDDGLCKIWDRRALRESNPVPVGTFAGHVDGLTFIDPRGDGRHLITNSKDQSIKLWDLRKFSSSSAVVATLNAVRSQHWDYRWQSVPRKLNSKKTPKKEIDTDVSIMTYRGHKVLQTLIRCHFSPLHSTGQKYIYTGDGMGRVVVYDALSGDIVRDLCGHQSCVRDVSWSPNAHEIFSSSWDSTIGKWSFKEDFSEDEHDVDHAQDGQDTCLRRSRRLLLRHVDCD